MLSNTVGLIVFFLCTLIVLRGYMGLLIPSVLSKNKRKHYKKDFPLLNRWFFWSAHLVMEDRYDKYEKKIIHYSSIMKLYRFITIYLHIIFFVFLIFAILDSVFSKLNFVFQVIGFLYLSSAILCFIIFAIIEQVTNRRYHRNRQKWRK